MIEATVKVWLISESLGGFDALLKKSHSHDLAMSILSLEWQTYGATGVMYQTIPDSVLISQEIWHRDLREGVVFLHGWSSDTCSFGNVNFQNHLTNHLIIQIQQSSKWWESQHPFSDIEVGTQRPTSIKNSVQGPDSPVEHCAPWTALNISWGWTRKSLRP